MTGCCFRCHERLDEYAKGILIMYQPKDPTDAPMYTLPRMYCSKCMKSFYDWAKGVNE